MKKFKLISGHKENYFILILGVVLVIIVIAISIISYQGSTPPVTINTPPPVVHIPTQSQTEIFATPTPNTVPPVQYDTAASHQLIMREEQRISLSQSDSQAKTHILSLLPTGQNYGTVYASNNINIQYVQSLDLFKVEILTVDVKTAKTEAETWFEQQGMSQQGICDLPLGFYLSWDTSNILETGDFTFNPLPDGC